MGAILYHVMLKTNHLGLNWIEAAIEVLGLTNSQKEWNKIQQSLHSKLK